MRINWPDQKVLLFGMSTIKMYRLRNISGAAKVTKLEMLIHQEICILEEDGCSIPGSEMNGVVQFQQL